MKSQVGPTRSLLLESHSWRLRLLLTLSVCVSYYSLRFFYHINACAICLLMMLHKSTLSALVTQPSRYALVCDAAHLVNNHAKRLIPWYGIKSSSKIALCHRILSIYKIAKKIRNYVIMTSSLTNFYEILIQSFGPTFQHFNQISSKSDS